MKKKLTKEVIIKDVMLNETKAEVNDSKAKIKEMGVDIDHCQQNLKAKEENEEIIKSIGKIKEKNKEIEETVVKICSVQN